MGVGHAHALYVHEHSPIHDLAPETKVAAVLLFVLSVAVTPGQAVWAFALYTTIAVGVLWLSRIPLRFLTLRLAGILPFILFAFFIPFIGSGERIDFLWFTVSVDGAWAAWGIVAKATLGATASILLVATTEVPGILRGLAKLKVPVIVVTIAGFMIRYLELIVDEVQRMRQAMASRAYEPRWMGHVRPIATGAGSLFIRSYERGERVHSAMVSRGYDGTMPVLSDVRLSGLDWAKALGLPLMAAIAATVALVVG